MEGPWLNKKYGSHPGKYEFLFIKIRSDIMRDLERLRGNKDKNEFYEGLLFLGACEYKRMYPNWELENLMIKRIKRKKTEP